MEMMLGGVSVYDEDLGEMKGGVERSCGFVHDLVG
jgi:hypothetical protein